MSHHSEDISERPKADKGLSKAGSYAVRKETGVFLAVGSGFYSLKYKYIVVFHGESISKLNFFF